MVGYIGGGKGKGESQQEQQAGRKKNRSRAGRPVEVYVILRTPKRYCQFDNQGFKVYNNIVDVEHLLHHRLLHLDTLFYSSMYLHSIQRPPWSPPQHYYWQYYEVLTSTPAKQKKNTPPLLLLWDRSFHEKPQPTN